MRPSILRGLPTARVPALLALALLLPSPADAYIGPGAGFALLSSFLVMLVTLVLAMAALVAWPVRAAWRLVTGERTPKAVIRRLIIIGLDGQDPGVTDKLLAEGRLPNFARLAAMGSYTRLKTTFPAVSPVAWSSFSTGTNPARHNVFDFLDRDRRTYLPVLSSAHVGRAARVLKLGRYRIPLARPAIRLLRRSKPFWSVLGEHRVWSTVLRVPITFPPDRFYGAELSAMSAPDLLGSQGTFTLFTTRTAGDGFSEGGRRVHAERKGDAIDATLEGPGNPLIDGEPPMSIPLTLRTDGQQVEARVGDARVRLVPGQLSDWVPVVFHAAFGVRVHGICRLLVTEVDPEFSLYVSPINIDPDRPAMPISHPSYYAPYLAARIGPFATLGLAEDTWALNEEVIGDEVFLRQAYDVDRERRDMFFAALDRLRQGMLVTVFDATDRIQHMFWRDLEPDGHPAAAGRTRPARPTPIEALYAHNDALVGQALERLGKDEVLMVMSDHGFAPFRRGVNVNRWLLDHGYLRLKPGADGSADWLRDVDWASTRAYALGLTSIFLNIRGREGSGIVDPAQAGALKAEVIAGLSGLRDEDAGEVAVREVFDTAAIFDGPYLGNAPDLIVGYNRGYRVSWACAAGVVAEPLFTDNVKAWSGDHSVDPRLVPGVLFCNRRIDVDEPSIVDIAPTALRLFGIEPPAYMEGRPLFAAPGGPA